ncbi:MAG TPA: hypothetical protein VFX81_08650 [Burkholderiaceae bacterium]|nr:hypothetical protein [Burkholderiaceae bacterium]
MVDERRGKAAKASRNDEREAVPVDRLEASFARAFGLVAFIMNRHLVDHMIRSARQFKIDYQTLVLWGVLAHQNCAHLFPPGSLPSKVLDDQGRLPDPQKATLRPLRLRHLSEITGVPRETTRRKLKVLNDLGWITEVKEGWLVDPQKIGPDVRDFTLESARRLLAASAEVTRALRNAEQHLPD